MEQPGAENLLAIGRFSFFHLLDKTVVRKIPLSDSEEDAQPIIYEATIYKMLGKHPRIAECLSMDRTDYVDIKYYPNGDLESYSRKNKDSIPPALREKWFLQIIEAVDYLHQHGVMRSDLALRQFLLDDELNTRLAGFDKSHHYLGPPPPPPPPPSPSTSMSMSMSMLSIEQVKLPDHVLLRDYYQDLNPQISYPDLFALGSTLYELLYGNSPDCELHSSIPDVCSIESGFNAWTELSRETQLEIETLYRQQVFPDVTCVFAGEIIMGCWKGEFSSAKEALQRYTALVKEL